MSEKITYFNPLKNYYNGNHGDALQEILYRVDNRVSFIGDDTGYFFSMFRDFNNPSLTLSDKKFHTFFWILQQDTERVQRLFEKYHDVFITSNSMSEIHLLDHFEERIYTEGHPYLQSYILMVLCNFSKNINSEFSNFAESLPGELIKNKINNFNKYNIANNEIHFKNPPKGSFIVSYERDVVDGVGVLITKRNIADKYLIKEVEDYKYYYFENGTV